MNGDCFIREFQSFWQNSLEESNSVTKKHHVIEHSVHVDIITFIRYFQLIIPTFHLCPVPVFLAHKACIKNAALM